MITHTVQCSNMNEMLAKIELWEQAWARYAADYEVVLGVELKLGTLMEMLPSKESDVIKLKYVENEGRPDL